MELTSTSSISSKSSSSNSKASSKSVQGDEGGIIKEGFVYIKCKNITFQNKIKRYMILNENSLEIYDVTSGMLKVHIDLSDKKNEIYLCDVYQKHAIIKKTRDSCFSIRSLKPSGKFNEGLPDNPIEEAKEETSRNKSFKKGTIAQRDHNSNKNLFDWICFKTDNEFEKKSWMTAIAKVRLSSLQQNPQDYDLLFPSYDCEEDEDDDDDDDKKEKEVKRNKNEKINNKGSDVEVLNPIFTSKTSSRTSDSKSAPKKTYYFYVDESDYRGIYSKIVEFTGESFYNYGIPAHLISSPFPVYQILLIGIFLNLTLIPLFVLNVFQQYISSAPGTFLSPTLSSPPQKTRTQWSSFTQSYCDFIPREISGTYSIDSNGYWSSNSKFTAVKSIANVQFTSFNSSEWYLGGGGGGGWLLGNFQFMNEMLSANGLSFSLQVLSIYTDNLQADNPVYGTFINSGQLNFNIEASAEFLFSQTLNLGTFYADVGGFQYTNEGGGFDGYLADSNSIPIPMLNTKSSIDSSGSYVIRTPLNNNVMNLTKLHEVNVIIDNVTYSCNNLYLAFATFNYTVLNENIDLKLACLQHLYGTYIPGLEKDSTEKLEMQYDNVPAEIDLIQFFNFSLEDYVGYNQLLYSEYVNIYDPDNLPSAKSVIGQVEKTIKHNFDSINIAAFINSGFLNITNSAFFTKINKYSNVLQYTNTPGHPYYPDGANSSTLEGWSWYTYNYQKEIRIVCRDTLSPVSPFNTTTCAVPLTGSSYGGYVSPQLYDSPYPSSVKMFYLDFYYQVKSPFNPCSIDTSLVKEDESNIENGFLPICDKVLRNWYVSLHNYYLLNSGLEIGNLGSQKGNILSYGLNNLDPNDIDCSLPQFNETFFCVPPSSLTETDTFTCTPPQYTLVLSSLGSSYANIQLLSVVLLPGILGIMTLYNKIYAKKKQELTEQEIVDSL